MLSFFYGFVPFSVHFTSYWFFVGLFYPIDKKYIYNSVNKQKYLNAIKKSLTNQIFYGLPLSLLLAPNIKLAIEKSLNDTFMISILKILFIANISNLLFYIVHRLLHYKYLYKLIHKVHHEYIITVSPCALYAHPIEYIIANNLVFLIPYCLIGTKYNIGLIMIIFGSLMTTSAHINQKLLFISDSHLYHHKKFNYNYGFGKLIDNIFLTSYNYNGKLQKKIF
jgi:sterol desaturase/sphingolipid hydroxylase (fatty acid hydroxylase superfamily)